MSNSSSSRDAISNPPHPPTDSSSTADNLNPTYPQHPIPPAEINTNPNLGRIGPVITFPTGVPNLPRNPDPQALRLQKFHQVRGRRFPKSVKADEGVDTTSHASTSNTTDDKDIEDLGDDGDDSDFELVDHPVYTPTSSSPTSPVEAIQTSNILNTKIPPELVSPILDYAEYFPHSVIGSRDTEDSVGNASQDGKVYFTAKIPEFEALEAGTAGKGGDESQGRPGRVRRLVFKITSRDQGWSSFPQDRGRYTGAYSWIEVELWRPSSTSSDNGEKQMEKVESCVLQRNKHATGDYTDHEIVWDWKEDELDDADEEKWEVGCTHSWYRDGHLSKNGGFVRKIRGGDELRIVLHAMFAGWRCLAEKGSVECFWAV